ncbi:uncharacterized protein TM35_000391310, partial [Trypanosoma theileri]
RSPSLRFPFFRLQEKVKKCSFRETMKHEKPRAKKNIFPTPFVPAHFRELYPCRLPFGGCKILARPFFFCNQRGGSEPPTIGGAIVAKPLRGRGRHKTPRRVPPPPVLDDGSATCCDAEVRHLNS